MMTIWMLGPGITVVAQGEKGITLSLSQALEKAKQNNWAISKARADEAAAKAQYGQTHSVFLPRIGVSHTGVTTNDPLSSFGFKLKQEVVTAADFSPSLLNDPSRINNFSTRIEVEQPLINLDGIYGRKAASASLRAMEYRSERTIHHVRFEVKRAYYALQLTQQSRKVIHQSLELAHTNLVVAQNNLVQGYVKEADVMAAKVRTLELANALTDADNKVQQTREFLAYLLGMDMSVPISTTDSLEVEAYPLVSLEMVRGGRSDLMAYEQGVVARKQLLKSKKMQFLPRINGFGSYEWNDDKLLGMGANNYMIGARLSWTLFGGYKNIGAVKQAKAELQKAELDYGEYVARNGMEIETARRNLKVAYEKIAVSRLARDQAKESLRIRTNRYKQGLERTVDLLMAETSNSNRELAYLKSLYDYHIALFKVEMLLEVKKE